MQKYSQKILFFIHSHFNNVQKTLGYLFRAVAHLMHKTVTYEVQKNIPIFTLYLILAKRENMLKFCYKEGGRLGERDGETSKKYGRWNCMHKLA